MRKRAVNEELKIAEDLGDFTHAQELRLKVGKVEE